MARARSSKALFAKAMKKSRDWLNRDGAEEAILSVFAELLRSSSTPQSIANVCEFSYIPFLTHRSVVDSETDPIASCKHIKRIWRYSAFSMLVYLVQGDRLVAEMQANASNRSLRIGVINEFTLSTYALNICFSITVQEDASADWMAHRLAEVIKRCPPYLDAEALKNSKVAQFCLKLYERWRGVDLGLPCFPDQSVLGSVIDTWDFEPQMRIALNNLCDYHVNSDLNRDLFLNDGIEGLISMIFGAFPVEILSVLKVRADLGMPLTGFAHPLLETPVATLRPTKGPFAHDQPFDEMRSCVEALLGPLQLPWE